MGFFKERKEEERKEEKKDRKEKSMRCFIPALLLLTKAQSFFLTWINYAQIHQNSSSLPLRVRSLKWQFQLSCLFCFGIQSTEVGQERKRDLWRKAELMFSNWRVTLADIVSLSPSHRSRWKSPAGKGPSPGNREKQVSKGWKPKIESGSLHTGSYVSRDSQQKRTAPHTQFGATKAPFLLSASISWVLPVCQPLFVSTIDTSVNWQSISAFRKPTL